MVKVHVRSKFDFALEISNSITITEFVETVNSFHGDISDLTSLAKSGVDLSVCVVDESMQTELKSVCQRVLSHITSGKVVERVDLDNFRSQIRAAFEVANPQIPYEETKSSGCIISDPVIWWISHKLAIGDSRILADLIGRNSKTSLNVKLLSSKERQPVRESLVDSVTHKNIMSYYFTRQEELRKLAEDDDDSYLSSEWTDPNALKHALHGCPDGLKLTL